MVPKEYQISIIGLGYVGLPLAISFAEAGLMVYGIEVNQGRLDLLSDAKSYLEEISSERLKNVIDGKKTLIISNDYKLLEKADAVIICVPTPLNKTKEPDLSYIVDVSNEILKYIHKDQLIILESTVYPGATEEIVLPILEKSNLKIGKDFFLAFSPERVDPGRSDWQLHNTPKVIGGVTQSCVDHTIELYKMIVERVIPVSSIRVAEMVKLLENTFRAVNIGLVNEIALICERLKIDVWEVIDTASTKPFGFMGFQPGPGLGGHCIPIDPHYLSWKLKSLNYQTRFIDLASEINAGMPQYVVDKLRKTLGNYDKPLKGSTILIIGVAYKRNVKDVRDSPAIDVIHLLQEQGAIVSYHDPLVDTLTVNQMQMSSVTLNRAALNKADCVAIITDHSSLHWEWIVKNSTLIIDTRNATKNVPQSKTPIVKL